MSHFWRKKGGMIGRHTQKNTFVGYYNVYFMYNVLIIPYLLEKFTCYSHAIRWDIFIFFKPAVSLLF